ncbi:hypothetical protein SDJN02_17682, partial [Cucurbita argyrosperma subsp. argyrosperma]
EKLLKKVSLAHQPALVLFSLKHAVVSTQAEQMSSSHHGRLLFESSLGSLDIIRSEYPPQELKSLRDSLAQRDFHCQGVAGSHSEDGALQHTLLCGSVSFLTGASDEDFCNSHEIEMVRVADGVLSYSKISLLLLQPNSFEEAVLLLGLDVGASQLSSMATTRNLAVEVVSRDRAIPRKTAPALDRAIPRKTAPALDPSNS